MCRLLISTFMYLWAIHIFIISHNWSAEDRSGEYINRSEIHEYRNWEQGRAVSFLEIYVSNFHWLLFDSQCLICGAHLLALPKPKSLSVRRVNRRCSAQARPWLKIRPGTGPEARYTFKGTNKRESLLRVALCTQPLRITAITNRLRATMQRRYQRGIAYLKLLSPDKFYHQNRRQLIIIVAYIIIINILSIIIVKVVINNIIIS